MKTTILLLGVLAFGQACAQCSLKGPGNATQFSDDNTAGSFAWGSPSKATESDDSYSIASISLTPFTEGSTHYLVATGFKFSIPSGASICGVAVQVERHYEVTGGSLQSITDKSVRLIRNGSMAGSDRSANQSWLSTDAGNDYGGTWDSWGLTLTSADVNSADFGVAISATINSGVNDLTMYAMIDHISVTVYYNAILPVHFKSFTGEREQDHVRLS